MCEKCQVRSCVGTVVHERLLCAYGVPCVDEETLAFQVGMFVCKAMQIFVVL